MPPPVWDFISGLEWWQIPLVAIPAAIMAGIVVGLYDGVRRVVSDFTYWVFHRRGR